MVHAMSGGMGGFYMVRWAGLFLFACTARSVEWLTGQQGAQRDNEMEIVNHAGRVGKHGWQNRLALTGSACL